MMEERDVDYGFMKILVGSLIIFFDFRINGFNLIPDFVGYILITMGLSKALQLDEKFKRAQFFAIAMIVLSIPNIIEFQGFNPLWPIAPIVTIVSLCMLWFLLGGITDVALRNGNESLADLSKKVLYATIIILVISASIGFAANILVYIIGWYVVTLAIVAIPLALIGLAVGLVELFVLYRSSNELTSTMIAEQSSLE